MSKESREIVQSKNVLEFVTVANEICLFLEEIEKYNMEFLLSYLQKVLPLLYLKGTMMPDIKPEETESNERFVTYDQWEKIYLSLLTRTGTKDIFYYACCSGNETESKNEKGSISENLADIYQDLKDFLLLYKKNTLLAQENAIHSCRKLFENNWGIKLLYSHQAIHCLMYGNIKNDDFFMGFSSN